jgi:CheY-like chemotaxis protein
MEECVEHNGSLTHSGVSYSAQRAAAPVCSSVDRGNGKLILVADDEQVLLRLTQRILRLNGFRVLEARNGREAVDLYRQHQAEIDLVILDAMMPALSGLEACQHIRQVNPEAKIILSTGHAEGDDIYNRIMALSRVHFVQKPYSAQQLVALVREVLSH